MQGWALHRDGDHDEIHVRNKQPLNVRVVWVGPRQTSAPWKHFFENCSFVCAISDRFVADCDGALLHASNIGRKLTTDFSSRNAQAADFLSHPHNRAD